MLKKDKENVDDLIEWRRHMLFTREKMANVNGTEKVS